MRLLSCDNWGLWGGVMVIACQIYDRVYLAHMSMFRDNHGIIGIVNKTDIVTHWGNLLCLWPTSRGAPDIRIKMQFKCQGGVWGISTGVQSSRYSSGRMTAGLFGPRIRKDWALQMLGWVVENPFMTTCFLTGWMAITLRDKKGIPARKLTSSSFTTRESSWKEYLPLLMKMWILPSTDMGVLPSARWAPWEAGLRGRPSLWAAVILIKLEVEPQSMVSLVVLWP